MDLLQLGGVLRELSHLSLHLSSALQSCPPCPSLVCPHVECGSLTCGSPGQGPVPCEAQALGSPTPAWLLLVVFTAGVAVGAALTTRLRRAPAGPAEAAPSPPRPVGPTSTGAAVVEAQLALTSGPSNRPVTPSTRHGGSAVPGHP